MITLSKKKKIWVCWCIHTVPIFYVNPYTNESKWADELFDDMGQFVDIRTLTLKPDGTVIPLRPHCITIDNSPPDISHLLQEAWARIY